MSCGESSGPHGIGICCKDDSRAPLRGEYVRQQPLGRLRSSAPATSSSQMAKCGTTWTQMICALLILQEPESPAPAGHALAVDRHGDSRPHRRVRGPGSPDAPPVHQDPHAARRDNPTIRWSRTSASGGTRATWGCRWTTISTTPTSARSSANANGRPRSTVSSPGHCGHRCRAPRGERDRFWQWADDETPFTQVGSSLRRTVEHLQTFRDAADALDVVYLHYDDLKAGLEGADAADGRAPRHRRRRAPMAPPGPGGDVRVDAQQGRLRPSPAAVRSTGSIPPRSSAAARAASGATSSTTPASPGTPRACGRSRPAASSSGCIASRSTEIPVRRYTRTTQS